LGLSLPVRLSQEARACASDRSSRRRAPKSVSRLAGRRPATIDMWTLKTDDPTESRRRLESDLHERPWHPNRASTSRTSPGLWTAPPSYAPCNRAFRRTDAEPYTDHRHPPEAALEYPSLGSLAAALLPCESGVPPHVLFDKPAPAASSGSRRFSRHRLATHSRPPTE